MAWTRMSISPCGRVPLVHDGLDLLVGLDVARLDERGADRFRERADAPLDEALDRREADGRPGLVEGLGDAPGDRVVVRDAEDERLAPVEQTHPRLLARSVVSAVHDARPRATGRRRSVRACTGRRACRRSPEGRIRRAAASMTAPCRWRACPPIGSNGRRPTRSGGNTQCSNIETPAGSPGCSRRASDRPPRPSGRSSSSATRLTTTRSGPSPNRISAAASASPAGLQRLLQPRYPRVLVRARGLSHEDFEAWYVYRDGSWVRSGAAIGAGTA